MKFYNPVILALITKILRVWCLVLGITGLTYAQVNGNVDLPRYPSVSPDGSTVVFSWRGDLWKALIKDGKAIRLTSHAGNETRSAWSGDGERIAFNSDRDGYGNIYIMNADGTNLQKVTDTDRYCSLIGFASDQTGREVLTFAAYLEGDVYRSPRPYMVLAQGGDINRIHNAHGTFPVISPDGKKLIFTRGDSDWSRRHYRGSDARNVWLYDFQTDKFSQLTNWAGNDGKARWIDKNNLIYLSDRENNCVNLYKMSLKAGEAEVTPLTKLTEQDIYDFDVSADGKTVVYSSWDSLYVLKINKSKPNPEIIPLYANEDEKDNYQLKAIDNEVTEAALSPDGQVMAYIAYGEVYIRNVDKLSPTVRVTNSHAREKEIVWSPDGLRLYFTSDADNTESIYAATVSRTRSEVIDEYKNAINPPKDDVDDDEEVDAAEKIVDGNESAPQTDNQSEAEAKTEELKIAEDGKAEKPAEKAEGKGDKEEEQEGADEVVKEIPPEYNPERWHDAIAITITPVIDEVNSNDRMPSPSPDGKKLAFRRGLGTLAILDLETNQISTLFSSWDSEMGWRWSPDSVYIAYHQYDINYNSDIWIVPADGSEAAVNISRHPNEDTNPRWSADGKILSFISERINNEFDLWMVYLDKDLEALNAQELSNYYEEAAKQAKERKPLKVNIPEAENEKAEADVDVEKNTEKTDAELDEENESAEEAEIENEVKKLDIDDAYLRLKRVTTVAGSESNNEMTVAGDRYIYVANGDVNGLYSVKWDGTEETKLAGPANVQHLTLDASTLVYIANGTAYKGSVSAGKGESVDISDRIRIDLQAQSSQKFLEAARALGEIFYHPTMKDLDWEKLTEKYHVLAKQARTADEFEYVASRLLGELNASHLGIYVPGDNMPGVQSRGRLGIVQHRVDNGFQVDYIIRDSPADKGEMALKIGDIISAINNQPITSSDTMESLLTDKAGKEILLTVQRTLTEKISDENGEDKEAKEAVIRNVELPVLITPVDFNTERRLKYTDWARNNAELVSELSDDKIGYIHIRGMDQPSLDEFERDLYAAAAGKEGLIIDVRNNGGGWTADLVLASIMVQKHAYTIPRGADPNYTEGYPQGRLFIQRYILPIDMLCNEKSFSNAEIVAHAFKTLKRGNLVGQQTYGGVISTGGTGLIDGTYVRLPLRGWFLPDGTDMENHGAIPDILVPPTPQAESMDQDEQLRAAVKDLIERI